MVLQENKGQQADLLSTVGQAVSPKRSANKQSVLVPPQQQDPAQEFKFTLAAARRTELRRLQNFVKMADYMMCDTLQQVAHCVVCNVATSLLFFSSRIADCMPRHCTFSLTMACHVHLANTDFDLTQLVYMLTCLSWTLHIQLCV